MDRFDYFATGPRMGLRVAVALETASLLNSLHIDAWVRPGRAANLVESIFGPRTRNRIIEGIAPGKIHAHPELFVLNRLARWATFAGRETGRINRLVARDFRIIARQCRSPAVFGMQGCCLELFEDRECTVMEQFAAPSLTERLVVQQEQKTFDKWTHARVSEPTAWDYRNVQEWQRADVIWGPSPYVMDLCERAGADRAKLRVLRYPIPAHLGPTVRSFDGSRPLRVIFAGTLMLRKGVQYIYEALRGWNTCRIDMHFFGHNQLTDIGCRRLSQVGTLHGPVSRAELLGEFLRSDVLLFPSVSEGSALVMAEAVATGLPVIATSESGPPDSATVIEARSPEAIRLAIETILDDPASLEAASQRCLKEAHRRTPELFDAELAALAKEALQTRARHRFAAASSRVFVHPDGA
jgi:glycosyltransferase involved in cell wall biosynthesis